MKVRRAILNDAGIIVDFQMKMAAETEGVQLDQETVTSGVKAVFDDPSRGIYYINEVNGIVVGSLLTTFEWSDWRNGTVLWIQSVYVIPEYRRQGVYRRMYAFLQELVQNDHALKGIRLYADMSNKVAHHAYHKLGMISDHYQTFEWLKK
jgi:GNAT superfamily N-acetyltransferase